MVFKTLLKRWIEQLTGYHIYRNIPRGIDLFDDLAVSLPWLQVDTVFDVGANVGQSCEIYLNSFPKARVYCFEPVSQTFAKLQQRVGTHPHVSSHRIALGASNTRERMASGIALDLSFRFDAVDDELGAGATHIEEVEVQTLDHFCATQAIHHVGLLKIDTEGGDLEVLKGANGLLSAASIDIVQVEAGMNTDNRRHVRFQLLNEFLLDHGYQLFAIYDQVHEWSTGAPNLRRTNPVFISSKLCKPPTACR